MYVVTYYESRETNNPLKLNRIMLLCVYGLARTKNGYYDVGVGNLRDLGLISLQLEFCACHATWVAWA
jgi:hypothetical protein